MSTLRSLLPRFLRPRCKHCHEGRISAMELAYVAKWVPACDRCWRRVPSK